MKFDSSKVNIRGVVQHKWRMVLIRLMVQDFTIGERSTFYSTRLYFVEQNINLSPYGKSHTIARSTIHHLYIMRQSDTHLVRGWRWVGWRRWIPQRPPSGQTPHWTGTWSPWAHPQRPWLLPPGCQAAGPWSAAAAQRASAPPSWRGSPGRGRSQIEGLDGRRKDT